MKNKKYILTALVVVVFGVIFIPDIISRLRSGQVVDTDRHQVGVRSFSADELPVMGEVPEFSFINQHGDTITNADYKGKVYVVEFFFTTCPTICLVMTSNTVKLQRAFKDRDNFGVASISINPENDTPEVLTKYAETYGITHPNWHLLTGDLQDVMALSNTGFNLYAGVNPNVEGGFEHSGMFALIDGEGRIRSRTDQFGNPIFYYDGTTDEGVSLIEQDIRTLLNE
ncbi:redoxin domain-containing protein [Robertkochia marina]|uniref:Redoxin domain-containing protein n=1 Tax=Robertkochia marina TaxID=1227945 RepID=A0A4S3M4H4_9FLAO|nr:SCO family protein [Robertkochia marina]THD69579.1 redoxin domain-containing protein [Robertkochia marina]TRZ47166.1 SCO family protein [Robertkochia marina]